MNIQNLRLNEVMIKKSHNSYERDETITEQLSKSKDPEDCNCRGIELDINFTECMDSSAHDFFKVYHKSESKKYLADYLTEIMNWHFDNPNHDFVFIALDLKDNTTKRAIREDISDPERYPQQLDRYLRQFFGEELIFTPKELLDKGNYPTLYAYISNQPWPTLEEIGPRFIFCVTGEWKSDYAKTQTRTGLCFADYFISGNDDTIPHFPIDENILFYNCKIHTGADRDKWTKVLPHLQERKLITRTYTIDNESLWTDALQTGVNILDTTKVSNYKWAQLQNGEAYMRQGYMLWATTHGTRYDTGTRPVLAIAKNGRIVEIHNGGGNNNLYYSLGQLGADQQIIWDQTGCKYNTGDQPTIGIAKEEIVVEIHTGGGNNNLYYNIGRLMPDQIKWIHQGKKYDYGVHPSVAATENGYIIEVHNGEGNNNLYYSIGHLDQDNLIDWIDKGIPYTTGDNPAVAILPDQTIIEIHNGGGNNNLYYSIGHFDENYHVYWNCTGVQYDTGDKPTLAITKDGMIVEMHTGGGNNNLYYNIGRLSATDRIDWYCIGMKYDTGDYPSAAIAQDGTIVESHNGGGNNNLYYNTGRLYGYK